MRRRLVAGLLLTALLGGCGTPDEQVTSGSTTTAVPGAGWEQLPPSPLSPRGGAALTTLEDGRLLVVGGDMYAGCIDHRAAPKQQDPMPSEPSAASSEIRLISTAALSCAGPEHDPRFNDGAILESATGTWKRISDAPAPLSGFSAGVVFGDTVYFWSPPSFAINGPTQGTWMSYDASNDVWEELASPPGNHRGYLQLVRAGEAVIAFNGSEENDPGSDLLYDPATDSWTAVPRDPLSPSFDRFMIWTGKEVVLLGREIVPNPGSERPSVVRAAAFDPETETWRRLPDSEISGGYENWQWSAGRVVNATPRTGNGGGEGAGDWGRDYPHGGMLDPTSGQWSELPAGAPAPANCAKPQSFEADLGYQAAGPDIVVNDGLALHVSSGRWQTVPCNPPRGDIKFASAWAFDGLVSFGGYDQSGQPGDGATKYEFSNTAWIWRPAG